MKKFNFAFILMAFGLSSIALHATDYYRTGTTGWVSFDGNLAQWQDSIAPQANDTTANVYLSHTSGSTVVTYLDGKTSSGTGVNYTYNSLTVEGSSEFWTGGPFSKKDASFSVEFLIVQTGKTFNLNVGNGSVPTSFVFNAGVADFYDNTNVALGGGSNKYVLDNLTFDSLNLGLGAKLTTVSDNVSVLGDVVFGNNAQWTIKYGQLNEVTIDGALTLKDTNKILLDFSYITEPLSGSYTLISSDSVFAAYKDKITIGDFSEFGTIAWDAQGNLVATVPVPEPASFAVFFALFTLVGARFLRTRKQK